ncbi:MAG: hypothetical protein ACR2LK_13985 [Solirubrobacteraceae bacterium]
MRSTDPSADRPHRHLRAVPPPASDAPVDDRRERLAKASALIGLEVTAARKHGRELGRSFFTMSIVDRHGVELTVTNRTEYLLGRGLLYALAVGVGHIPESAWSATGRREIAAALLRAAVDDDPLELVA